LDRAIASIGHLEGVDFNLEQVSFSLTASKQSYELGADIMTDLLDVMNIQQLWRTDTMGWDVSIVGLQKFSQVARKGTATGPPTHATLYHKGGVAVLEVYPIPASAHTMMARVKRRVIQLGDIPDDYHSLLIDLAVVYIKAGDDPNMAAALLRDGIHSLQSESLTSWTGSTIPLARHLGQGSATTRASSTNLRPE